VLGVYSVQFCVILSVLNINQDIGLLSFYSSLHNNLMLIFRFLYLIIKAMVSLLNSNVTSDVFICCFNVHFYILLLT